MPALYKHIGKLHLIRTSLIILNIISAVVLETLNKPMGSSLISYVSFIHRSAILNCSLLATSVASSTIIK